MSRHIVATIAEIPPGSRKIVEVAGRSIGIFNLAGELFALRNSCPHQGGELCRGPVSGFVTSTGPGDYALSRPGEIVRCPWHSWEFDIRTGQSWFDPQRMRVRRYEVTVEPGSALPAATDAADGAGRERGPYVAETYPVSIEQDYVVLELPR